MESSNNQESLMNFLESIKSQSIKNNQTITILDKSFIEEIVSFVNKNPSDVEILGKHFKTNSAFHLHEIQSKKKSLTPFLNFYLDFKVGDKKFKIQPQFAWNVFHSDFLSLKVLFQFISQFNKHLSLNKIIWISFSRIDDTDNYCHHIFDIFTFDNLVDGVESMTDSDFEVFIESKILQLLVDRFWKDKLPQERFKVFGKKLHYLYSTLYELNQNTLINLKDSKTKEFLKLSWKITKDQKEQ